MSTLFRVVVPDIGTEKEVEIIEVHVVLGDIVAVETPLITLENEKAAMEIPAPVAGKIVEFQLKVGDKVKKGAFIAAVEITAVETGTTLEAPTPLDQTVQTVPSEPEKISAAPRVDVPVKAPVSSRVASNASPVSSGSVYASPSVRRFARELGADLSQAVGTGRKGRLQKEDVVRYIKSELEKIQRGASQTSFTGTGLPQAPEFDFSQFGTVVSQPLSRIKKWTAQHLHRNWLLIPHVTQFDQADITDLEQFREKYKQRAQDNGYRLTILVFLMKAVAQCLKAFPQFNVSLSPDQTHVWVKQYYHIGVAVETPDGLVVPVIRDVDQKGLFQLALELSQISEKARQGQLKPQEMQGGCFTVSSLGGIGGTAFTPIVNLPEVAILGVSKATIAPVYQNDQFVPRLMLPLSLSYDHRVIDGAEAARFITHLSRLLADISQLLL